MTVSVVVFLCALVVFSSVQAVDYFIALTDQPILRCPGKEKHFFDLFFDYSKLQSLRTDEETTIIDGTAIFIRDITGPISYKMNIKEYKTGRWIDTGFSMNRPNICDTFFDENEIWHEALIGLPTDCPPKKGEKYEFHNRSLNIVLRNLSPAMQGLYRIESSFTIGNDELCFVDEGELVRLK